MNQRFSLVLQNACGVVDLAREKRHNIKYLRLSLEHVISGTFGVVCGENIFKIGVITKQ